jgi:hypothetical protein
LPVSSIERSIGIQKFREDWYELIGKVNPVKNSRTQVLQVADSIGEKLKIDTLPGIKADKIANLKTLRDAFTRLLEAYTVIVGSRLFIENDVTWEKSGLPSGP